MHDNPETGRVEVASVIPESSLPMMLRSTVPGTDLVAWVGENRDYVRSLLNKHGGALFRDFHGSSIEMFRRFTAAASTELLEYRERSSPRTQVSNRIYTSTEYPPGQEIFLHNENSYQQMWPQKIYFYCHKAALSGGETPIADCRRVLKRIDPEIQQRFMQRGWMAVRNFGDGFGLPWTTVFQTTDRSEVEEHCQRHGVRVEWKDGDRLRTRTVRPVVARHPETHELSWFNHATFFHVSTLDPFLREAMLMEFDAQDDLPTNSFYGDGSPIEEQVMDHLREAYLQEKVSFTWQEGDILMLDNVLVAHGREPFEGERNVLVSMADPHSWTEVAEGHQPG